MRLSSCDGAMPCCVSIPVATVIIFLALMFARQPLFAFPVLFRPRAYPARVYGLCFVAAAICFSTFPFLFHASARNKVDLATAGALVLFLVPIVRDALLGADGRALVDRDADSSDEQID